MYKRLTLALVTCLLAAGAHAADGDWTGWHIGGHIGYGSGSSDARIALDGEWSIETPALRDHVVTNWSADLDGSGATYGLQFGYDHQFANDFVLGLEFDYSRLDVEDTRQTGQVPVPSAPSLSYDFGNSFELDDRLALRGRFGYAAGRHLFYATAGWARVDAEATASVASNGNYLKFGRASETVDGLEWGVGYEFDFGNAWSLRAEYLATDLDDLSYGTDFLPDSDFQTPPYLETVDQDLDFDAFRIALRYRF